ncbi:MAG: GT4 family glycosyltransferase PelF [Caldilineaceae bacterium]
MINSSRQEPPKQRLRVLMMTEGTYPFHWGGVSTWCHLLMCDLPNIDFELLSLAAEPGMPSQFNLPSNVVAFHPLPLWGMRELLESRSDLTLAELRNRKRRTTEGVVAARFTPMFRFFLQELFVSRHNPEDLAKTIHAMHRFFLAYDFDATMRSRAVWQTLIDVVQKTFPTLAAELGYPNARYQLADMTTAIQWLYHWFFPLGAPIPKADVVHAAMVGICTLIGVTAKLEHGSAFMLTEHGIYLRERYLAETKIAQSFFLKVFNLCFARRMTELTYRLADQISPCCDYNHRWELRNGAQPEQIRTIYYGVDADTFSPEEKKFGDPPVVVWVGRIDPLKDLLTLIRAAGVVHQSRTVFEFLLFGSAPAGNESYYEECLKLRKELGLEERVIFAGYRANVAAAFNEGDVVVLSSISEAFPFVVLEAMLCAKPVVATSVGGIPEQLEGCGFALEPRNPEAMAEAILKLMGDPELCATLGQASRAKAEREFTVRQSGLAHDASYRRILKRSLLRKEQSARRMANEQGRHPPLLIRQMRLAGALQQQMPYLTVQTKTVVAQNGALTRHRHVNSLASGVTGSVVSLRNGGTVSVPQSAIPSHPQTLSRLRVDRRHSPINGQASDQANNRINGHATRDTNGHTNGHKNGQTHSQTNGHANKPIDTHVNGHGRNGQPNVQTRTSHSQGPKNGYPKRKAMADEQHGRTEHADAIAALAVEVAHRDREPIDALEITAVIESMGVTDEVAQQRYGAADAFALGEALFDHLKAGGLPIQPLAPKAMPRTTWRELLTDLSRGILALLPALVLLFCIFAYSAVGQWGQNLVLALSAGMTSSMLITNGFIQALSRRTSIYLGLGKPGLAGRFLLRSIAIALACLLGVILLAEVGMRQLGFFAAEERLVFALAFLSLSALWMAAGGLSLIQKTSWLALGMVSGLFSAAVTDYALRTATNWHLIIASVVGYGVAMAIILFALRQGYTDRRTDGAKAKKALNLPSRAYLLHEAAPYFGYGFLYMAFILLPHILGWLGALGIDQVRSWAVTSVELGLTASMPPIIIAGGVAEHVLRRFWRYTPALQAQTSGDALPAFHGALRRFYQRTTTIYLIALTLLSFGMHLLFQQLVDTGFITRWLAIPATPTNLTHLLFIFNGGLIAYGLLGWGIFSCMFCITLGAPQLAMRAVCWGLVATLIFGIPLSGLHYTLSTVAFISGAAVFVIVAHQMCNQVLQSSDYCFAMAL